MASLQDNTKELKSNIFFSTDKALTGKKLIGKSIVHTEKSLSYSFYHTFCRVGQNCVGQVEIKVYLPYLASDFKR